MTIGELIFSVAYKPPLDWEFYAQGGRVTGRTMVQHPFV